MSTYTQIDLSTLPAPDVVETLDFETILAAMLADLQARDPSFNALVESDPAYKILEVAAFREVLIRQRVNEASRAVMIAYSAGADLENLGALFGVVRKTITEADEEAIPPVAAVMESDTDFRARIQLALEGLSTAGPIGAYQFHALKVEGVKDVEVVGPPTTEPGVVLVTIMSNTGNGVAGSPLIAEVEAALSADDIRPLTDVVGVQSVTITNYSIVATLYISPGPDASLVYDAALASAQAFAAAHHKIGADIRISALHAALHVPGVERVTLSAPGVTTDRVAEHDQSFYCTAITLTTASA